ncbi:hypothetical protein IMG5_070770 [Ichthyophthirius multifiliis]|uniref:Tetratricopeptide repeat protein n=1 Tax=Ichthyophthirius multifiliis TaxID=5932 RepID=G0QPT0_ICHMU|nr:hypothetical protein IMG5_070770 [Ichthyophthirius multifiliis]EGR32795.1 hypothetical protein IMG5_070770 [Ichthyophthirius multifiliis]|eukprot:XP_004036781.1 hypothetical protein IMG5_070770 [Ichthyophthirius multifiliis]
MGQKYLEEGKLEESLEFFHNASNIIQNIYGPFYKDIGFCYSKIASIHYKQGDIMNSILYQKQSIEVFQDYYGFDSYYTAQAYSNLGFFYFAMKKYKLAYKYIYKSLFVFGIIGGEQQPDSFFSFMNLSLMLQENQQYQASLSCLFELLERSINIFGKYHGKTAQIYQQIAMTHYYIEDLKQAVEYQQKSVDILGKVVQNIFYYCILYFIYQQQEYKHLRQTITRSELFIKKFLIIIITKKNQIQKQQQKQKLNQYFYILQKLSII